MPNGENQWVLTLETSTGGLRQWPIRTDVITQIAPYKLRCADAWETLTGGECYNKRRLSGPIGYFPPAKAPEALYAKLNSHACP